MDYKETLNLPGSAFPMKGNLVRKEPEIQEYWRSIRLYEKMMESGEGKPLFVLHDGPPYANGDIHVGTAFNKILKDIIIKYKTMRGYRCPYVPGWDCHGQPIEHEVTKGLATGQEVDKVELRNRCRDYALKYVDRQREQFERLGVLGDFQNPYLTLDREYEATIIRAFAAMYEKGLIYRGSKPIHWCTSCTTALAEAEIEYEDKESYSVFLKFPVSGEFPPAKKAGKEVSLLVWTTTPWTLPANVAVALSPTLQYCAVDTGEEVLILARELADSVMEQLEVTSYRSVDTFDGALMEGMHCLYPFADRDSVIVLAPYVRLEQGTGCVHIAPGHGQEDYITGLEYDLPSPMPVDDHGRFTVGAGPFAGMTLDEANPRILEYLDSRGLLMGQRIITHQYPHCWRCKNPVVFRATPQWFIALDGDGSGQTLRRSAIGSIELVKWIPDWTINRIKSMVEKRPDWCISRQRAWGVPLPIVYCSECGSELINRETLRAIEELVRNHGADAWFSMDPSEFLTEGTSCPECGSVAFSKEDDIIDVWFESGVSHLAVLRKRAGLRWPADLYLEGSDQHRGWFQSSLLTSVGIEGRPPYEAVLTHGFTVDGAGRKMSKSLGNAIDPGEVLARSGAEILRLWTASTDYSTDVPISEEILERVTEGYRRFRNTLRFLIGNTHDFSPSENAVEYRSMRKIDRWMLCRFARLVQRVTELMDDWSFYQALQAVQLFCTIDLSSLYLDVLKDRLYTYPADSVERRSAQTAMFIILEGLIAMLAPVLAHTADEALLSLPEDKRRHPSVHLYRWPEYEDEFVDEDLEKRWGMLTEAREAVYRELEKARQKKLVGSGLEAKVELSAAGELLEALLAEQEHLAEFFIVSQVDVCEVPRVEGMETAGHVGIKIEAAEGVKCKRCWVYSPTVGESREHPDICRRCKEALDEIGA
jgi:isoleucyl-tRNA synthetase